MLSTSVKGDSNITQIGSADSDSGSFRNCRSLHRLVLPEGLESIDSECFSGCTALGEVLLPDSLRSLGAEVFCGYTALRSVRLPASVRLGRDAFLGCPFEP